MPTLIVYDDLLPRAKSWPDGGRSTKTYAREPTGSRSALNKTAQLLQFGSKHKKANFAEEE